MSEFPFFNFNIILFAGNCYSVHLYEIKTHVHSLIVWIVTGRIVGIQFCAKIVRYIHGA
jgi:hypothetical protein